MKGEHEEAKKHAASTQIDCQEAEKTPKSLPEYAKVVETSEGHAQKQLFLLSPFANWEIQHSP